MIWSPELYTTAWNFAAEAHAGQHVPGSTRGYINHVGTVAMEVMTAIARRGNVADPDLAVQCALLHDVVEDTDVTLEEISRRFGSDVAAGVSALTKNPDAGDKAARMTDSLARIREQPHEVWMVKLADRITNLQVPPAHWDAAKIARYHAEAGDIHTSLGAACTILGPRLLEKIDAYQAHVAASPS